MISQIIFWCDERGYSSLIEKLNSNAGYPSINNKPLYSMVNPTVIKTYQQNTEKRVSFFNEYYYIPRSKTYERQLIEDCFLMLFITLFVFSAVPEVIKIIFSKNF